MTQNLPDHLKNLDLTKSDGIESILTLFNLIPDPAIIYNKEKAEILAANNPFFLLTALGEKDFLGKPIQSILPNLTDINPMTGHGQKTRLRHKNQPSISVVVRIFSLAESSNLLLIILTPQELKEIVNNPSQEDLYSNLNKLLRSRRKKDLKSALIKVLDLALEILDAEITCIYKASSDKPQFVQYLASDVEKAQQLPNLLTAEDLISSQELNLWTPADPALNHLQKAAASANLSFLFITPLGQEDAQFGLFVAAGSIKEPQTEKIWLAKMIAEYITTLMENHIALVNSRNTANKVKQVVKIQSEIIANLEEGVIILSPDLTIAELNPAAETILGYANVEALRQPIDSILIGSESLGSLLNSARNGIASMISSDLTLHHRSGKAFPAQVTAAPVLSNGSLLAIVLLIQDTSQVEQSRAATKQLEKRAILGEVTAIFAHEVRNPINAINLALQVMEENLTEDDENLKWVEHMREESDKLEHLMESVLSFAKPIEYKMSGVDLDFLLKRLLERWQPRFRKLNITEYYESEIPNPVIEGDFRALEQVFTNLINNAVNAMSEKGGYLGVKIVQPDDSEDQNFVKVIITDTGPGIPDDIMEHIFKPFVTGSRNGTGLGLAITQRIVNAHKGRIEVDSLTGGTIFNVYLAKKKEQSEL